MAAPTPHLHGQGKNGNGANKKKAPLKRSGSRSPCEEPTHASQPHSRANASMSPMAAQGGTVF